MLYLDKPDYVRCNPNDPTLHGNNMTTSSNASWRFAPTGGGAERWDSTPLSWAAGIRAVHWPPELHGLQLLHWLPPITDVRRTANRHRD